MGRGRRGGLGVVRLALISVGVFPVDPEAAILVGGGGHVEIRRPGPST
jgi:hypothetical protein